MNAPSRRIVTAASREEWLGHRRIGSSDVAKILSVSTWGTAWEVWRRLHGDPVPDIDDPDRLRGRRWERRVLEDYADTQQATVTLLEPHTTFLGPTEWASASPDALVLVGDRRVGGVEAKTDAMGERKWGEPCEIRGWEPGTESIVRLDYALQAYHQAWVADLEWVDLAVLLPRYELRVFRLYRDAAIEEDVVGRLQDWYDAHVIGGREPTIDTSDACRAWLVARMTKATEIREADPRQVIALDEFRKARRLRKEWEQREKQYSAYLLGEMPDVAGLRHGELLAKRVLVSGRERTDWDAVRAAHPEIEATIATNTTRGQPSAHIRLYGDEE